MKRLDNILKHFNIKELKYYFGFTILFIFTIIIIGKVGFTQARYESDASVDVSPDLAFFIVDVSNQSGSIKLDGLVPRVAPYYFYFDVSNFKGSEHAEVDLTYSIEIITTTNMPLNFRIFEGSGSTQNEIDTDTTTTDVNGVYFRHLVINDANTMLYTNDVTNLYTLWVEFPEQYKNNADDYAGIIDLVDIKINAEQVV